MRRRSFTIASLSAIALALASLALPVASAAQLPRTAIGSPPPAGPAVGVPRDGANPRDAWQRVPDILDAVVAAPGSRIADVGSGEGYLTMHLARRVGPEGRVFAVDIDQNALGRLGETVAAESLRNVEVILGEPDDPRLPFGTLDGAVILNSYHEMPRRMPMLAGILRALKPGGLLVIVDNAPMDSTVSRTVQTQRHSLAATHVQEDLVGAGFEVVRRTDDFIDETHGAAVHRQWMLVARRVAK